jgi:hypothetical protein
MDGGYGSYEIDLLPDAHLSVRKLSIIIMVL